MSAKKRALGRGLDALLGSEKPSSIQSLPIEKLSPNRLQPRENFEEGDLEELVRSIEAQGVIQPLVVAPLDGDRYMIIAGERRWRAAQRARLDQVPVVVREVKDDRQLLEMALVENLQRSDLNAIEEAEAYRKLQQEFGLTQEQVAEAVGKSRSTVANSLRLLKLPAPVRELLREGRLTAGQARPLLALEDAAEQLRLARQAAAGKLNARQLEARAAAPASRGRASPGKKPDPDTEAAAEKLTRRLQTQVQIRRSGRGGTIRLAFFSEEELMRLYEMLMKVGS